GPGALRPAGRERGRARADRDDRRGDRRADRSPGAGPRREALRESRDRGRRAVPLRGRRAGTERRTAMIGAFAVTLLLGCAPPQPAPAQGTDHPPADIRSERRVRCLVDAPDGCSGCDQGTTCVYEQMKEYDCVYIVYGTKCEDAPKK